MRNRTISALTYRSARGVRHPSTPSKGTRLDEGGPDQVAKDGGLACCREVRLARWHAAWSSRRSAPPCQLLRSRAMADLAELTGEIARRCGPSAIRLWR